MRRLSTANWRYPEAFCPKVGTFLKSLDRWYYRIIEKLSGGGMRVDLVPLCSFPAVAFLIPTVCSEGQHRSSRICFIRVWKPAITQKALTQLIILTRRNLEKHESTNLALHHGLTGFLKGTVLFLVCRLSTQNLFPRVEFKAGSPFAGRQSRARPCAAMSASVREQPTKRVVPQTSSSKEAARVRDALCPARGYSPTAVRHHRCANLSVPRLGGPRKPRGAVSPDLELPPAWRIRSVEQSLHFLLSHAETQPRREISVWLPSARFSGFCSTVSQPPSSRFAVCWPSPSRKPIIVWCRFLLKRKCKLCSTLLIPPRGWEFEIGRYCTSRFARASESRN